MEDLRGLGHLKIQRSPESLRVSLKTWMSVSLRWLPGRLRVTLSPLFAWPASCAARRQTVDSACLPPRAAPWIPPRRISTHLPSEHWLAGRMTLGKTSAGSELACLPMRSGEAIQVSPADSAAKVSTCGGLVPASKVCLGQCRSQPSSPFNPISQCIRQK